jgi:hypothetical protein
MKHPLIRTISCFVTSNVTLWIAIVLGTLWLLNKGSKGAEIATVIALAVGIATLAYATVWRLGTDDRNALAAAAVALAREIGGRQAAEQQSFLADRGKGTPADIGFIQPRRIVAIHVG